jgi:hypothetical protein
MTHKEAEKQGLQPVFPQRHELGERIFWDSREGEYYDAGTDSYLWHFDPQSQNPNGWLDVQKMWEKGCQNT